MSTRRRVSPADRKARAVAVDDPAVVFEAALRFLEARQRSTAEVRRRLGSAGYREELVTGAVERLAELGMLDDAAFAQSWVESRDRARPRGERALRSELARKGIDRQVVDQVLEDRGDDPDAAAARRLLARYARALERVADPRARRQRAYALLARNGFDSETASTVAASIDSDAEAPAS
jgi:regulatory protein